MPYFCGGVRYDGIVSDKCYTLSNKTWQMEASLETPRGKFVMNYLPFSDYQSQLIIVGEIFCIFMSINEDSVMTNMIKQIDHSKCSHIVRPCMFPFDNLP